MTAPRLVACLLAPLCFCLLAMPARAVPITSAGSGNWTNAATWSGGIPTNTDDVTILSSHTVTMSDVITHYVNSLTLQTNAVLTHASNSTTAVGEQYKVILNVTSNLTIDAGGSIDALGRGYSADNGPGKGPDGGDGGSYGGVGGDYLNAGTYGVTYGSITAPTNLGSGSGEGVSSGGGVVQLTVSGATYIWGAISANGSTPGGGYSGSGGSVHITTGTISGSGAIRANGASGFYGGGGGGRIAIILTEDGADFSSFSNATVTAYGGGAGNHGAAGTVYRQLPTDIADQGELIVDNNDVTTPSRVVTDLSGNAAVSNSFIRLTLRNAGIMGIGSNDTINITGATITADGTDQNEGIQITGGTLITDSAFFWTNCFIKIVATSTFDPATSVTVGTNASLIVDAAYVLVGDLTIQAGGNMTHSDNSIAEVYKMNLAIMGNLTLDSGGTINVDGLGFDAINGPGKGPDNGDGGSYGGVGGDYMNSGIYGVTYGSITAPTNLGSGSDAGVGPGGGAVRLIVAGASSIWGVISANGATPGGGYSGSGGSVYITTGTISGSGAIRANGASGAYGGGGGGRIAIILTDSGADFSSFGNATVTVYGGALGYYGGAGTIYRQSGGQRAGYGNVLIDNNGVSGKTTLPAFTNAIPEELKRASLIVTNNPTTLILTNSMTVGDIHVYTNSTLNLNHLTLTVNSTKHDLGGGATNNAGRIVWLSPGMMMVIQ